LSVKTSGDGGSMNEPTKLAGRPKFQDWTLTAQKWTPKEWTCSVGRHREDIHRRTRDVDRMVILRN